MSSSFPTPPPEFLPYVQYPLTLDKVANHASKLLLRDGFHVQMLILEIHQHPPVLMLLPTELETSQARTEWAFALGHNIATTESVGNLEQVFFISEVWSLSGDKMPQKPVSEHPERKELLSVFYRNVAENELDWRSYEMIRNQQGSLNKVVPINDNDNRIVSDAILKPIVDGYQQGLSK